MIRFSHTVSKGVVFVRCSENAEEEKQLNILVQEVNMVCGMTQKTGLWIVAEFQVNLRKVVVTSLEEKVEIDSDDIAELQAEAMKRLQGERNV